MKAILDRRGTTAVEFALIGPVLFLFLFGIVETGLMLWTWQGLETTADDTSRCVAIGSSLCPTPTTYAVQRAAAYGIPSVTTSEVTVVTASTSCGGTPTGTTMVQVTISIPFTSEALMFGTLLPTSLKAVACYPSAT